GDSHHHSARCQHLPGASAIPRRSGSHPLRPPSYGKVLIAALPLRGLIFVFPASAWPLRGAFLCSAPPQMCWSDSTLAKAGMPLESDPILDDQEPFPVWTAVRNRRRGAPFAARRFTCTDGQRDRFAQYSQAKPRRPRVLWPTGGEAGCGSSFSAFKNYSTRST